MCLFETTYIGVGLDNLSLTQALKITPIYLDFLQILPFPIFEEHSYFLTTSIWEVSIGKTPQNVPILLLIERLLRSVGSAIIVRNSD